MGSQDQQRSPNLNSALAAHYTQQQAAADEAARPAREEHQQQLDADAALFGTAGWLTLSEVRRRQVGAHMARTARKGAA
ncbi:hypothetical protein [Streptomyces candidus]|uniref:Uncharacterized protein n=1 Tax=Streptomyces candidus TaxID=67283 RepID=A0A7X0LQ40_9ACTN|nr:hypothetical protein [Streptomyces candidus]MBB6437203.1 hypothetical protein [Streptomyces candidus]GHH38198.1 hypothetical protein GCM10018773_15790 [Streptomyces candidus]